MITLIVILTAFLAFLLVLLAGWLLIRKTRRIIVEQQRGELRRRFLHDLPPLLFAESSVAGELARESWQTDITPRIGKVYGLLQSGSTWRRRLVRDVARDVLAELSETVIGETHHRIGYIFERLGYVEEELARLTDRRWWIRGEAARRLGIMRSRLGVLPLVQLLKDPEQDVRSAAAQSLIDIAGVKGALHSILQNLSAISPWMEVLLAKRVLAAGTLSVEPLLAALDSQSRTIQMFSIKMLGELRSPEALEPLVARFPHLEPVSKDVALVALGKCGDERALALLETNADSPSEGTRCAAIAALGHLGAPSTVPLLVRMLFDPRLAVQRAAGEALTKILPAGKTALADVARREEGQSRTIALHYLDLLALREEGV